MWYDESVFYQIYPLGYCGAPFENDGVLEHRILKVIDWIPHMVKLGINAIYFSPVFESDTHGYNTRDYGMIDKRLGTNEDFKKVVDELHANGIKVVLDGVFNHVGRGFWAFKDVQEKKWDSPYKDWFHLSFDGNSNYNDGFWYEGWEGNYDLVKLNLCNPAVVDHIFDKVKFWTEYFDIDGLRLDVAYMLDKGFIHNLREFTNGLKPEFLLLGELMFGDYNQFVGPGMLDSCTDYAAYKSLYSSFNTMNMFELVNNLIQFFGPENWSWYRGKNFLNFCDNHDVTRIASVLNNKAHLPLCYTLMYGMPGVPCVYYGSEWGTEARKEEGDPALRACFEKPEWNELTSHIAKLSEIHKEHRALQYGNFNKVLLTNHQCIIERKVDGYNDAEGNWIPGERILVAINAGDYEYTAHFDAGCGQADELITGTKHDFGGGSVLKPFSSEIWLMEN